MDTCHTVPNCLDMKETIRDGPDNRSSNILQRNIHPSFSGQRLDLSDDQVLGFLEAAASPAKYALFHYFGHLFLSLCGFPTPLSSTSSIKIGALGGTMLTVLYFALLLRRRPGCSTRYNSEGSIMSYATNFCKEIFYSAVAAALGVLGCAHKTETTLFVIVGALGPVIFLITIAILLILAASVVWCVERFRDWLAGY